MTYQTLYRKYRSQTFSDLVGQEAITRALQGAIASDRVAHAYLFSGSRGTGKTSSARLLAKAINCLSRAPGTAEPCGECESCTSITGGTALDLIEIDAASNRGIDEIRDLREKVALTPALGRRKVYIIDEAHMLTTEAFNALLKTLEEPPEHVVFVLCTTESQKVPLTVLGRCQQFVFRRFNDEQVVARLRWIASREGVTVEPGALELVARVAQGSMRDGLGLFDQLIPLTSGQVTVAAARELLGIADPVEVSLLVDAVLAGRATEALDRLGAIYERGGELRQVVRGIMERCRDLLVAAIEERDTARRDRLSRALDDLLHLDGEVRRHAEPRFLVEATLVRLAVEGGPVAAAVPAPVPVPVAAPVVAAPVVAAPVVTPEPPVVVVEESRVSTPEPFVAAEESRVSTPEPFAAAPAGDVAERWGAIVNALNPLVKAAFRAARPELEGDTLVLWFESKIVHEKAQQYPHAVQPAVVEWLGEGARVEYRMVEEAASAGPPARTLAPEEADIVQRAVRQLEGRVTKVSVPKESSR